MYYGGPSASAIAWNGRLQRRGHEDGTRRRTPAKACALLWLTKLEQRAMGDVWSCWGDGGAIAVAGELGDGEVLGYNGGAAGLDDGETLVKATVAQSNATPSIYGLQGSYCVRSRGLGWSG